MPTIKENSKLWEILIPACSNKGVEYSLEHHRRWDKEARKISKGITILGSAKGQWKNPQGKTFSEKMIPVRLRATTEEIRKIGQFTLKHYQQEAVWVYEISSNIIEIHK
jgi:hypothetical protein